jgi:CheY-like chemotaxis protein
MGAITQAVMVVLRVSFGKAIRVPVTRRLACGISPAGIEVVPDIPPADPMIPSEIPHMPEKIRVLRVLIVDDEPLIRWSLAETLTESGHLVSEAADGMSALESLNADQAPDVIVLDYRLPDSSDLSLLESIRVRAPGSAVIMMTAFGAPEMTRQALSLGAWRIVAKPFEVHEMADLVNQARSWAMRQCERADHARVPSTSPERQRGGD